MRSRWKALLPLDPDREYVALATSIPPRSRRSTLRLFRGANAVKRQLRETDGLVGYSLLANPVAKQYATLSLWTDHDALARFARSGDHGRFMTDLAPEMGPTRFERWSVRGADGPPTWEEALALLR